MGLGPSGFGFGADPGGKTVDREPVAVDSKTGKCRKGGHGGEGMMTEAFASVDVADMHFDCWNLHRLQGVMQRNRGMGIGPGIDDDPGRLAGTGLVDELDQFALAIGLPAIGLQAELRGRLPAQFLDIGQRRMAVFLRLARPLHVEVRPVENIDRVGRCFSHSGPGGCCGGGRGYR